MELVEVVWHDAHADRSGGWVRPEDIDGEPYKVRSVGWRVVAGKPGHVTLAQSIGDDGTLDHVLHIPFGMIASETVRT